MNQLHWLDYLILSAFLGASLAIGVFQAFTGGHQRTTDEFLLDNRRLKIFPTAVSTMVSLRSGLAILGTSAEVYNWGIEMPITGQLMGITLGCIITERFFVPWLYKLKITSTYEYIQLRFQSKAIRKLASFIGITNSIIHTGTSLLGPSLALEVAAGLPREMSTFVLAIFCTIYTALGGMRGVIWNDVLQGGIMLGGLCFVLVQGTKKIGGFQQVLDIGRTEGRLNFATFNPSPIVRSSFWTMLIGLTGTMVNYGAVQQMSVQRYIAMPSLRSARKMVLLSGLFSDLFCVMTSFVGLVQFAYFISIKCDPLQSGLISSPDQISSLYMRLQLVDFRGTNGVFLMILYSSSLSTISSATSAAAANIWEDFLKPLLGNRLSEFQATLVTKFLVVLISIVGVGMAFLFDAAPGNLMVLTILILGALGGPLLGVFLLGGLSVRTEWIGALTGGIIGLVVNMVLFIGGTITGAMRHTPLPPGPTTGCSLLNNNTYSMDIRDITPGPESATTIDTMSYFEDGSTSNFNTSEVFYPKRPLSVIQSIFGLSTFLHPAIGCIVTVFVGYIVSVVIVHYMLGRDYRPVDRKYLMSFREALKCSQVHVSDIELSGTYQDGKLQRKKDTEGWSIEEKEFAFVS